MKYLFINKKGCKISLKISLVIGIILFLFINCEKESPIEEENQYTIENYFPLAVGNKWVYKYWYVDTLIYIDSIYITESYNWNNNKIYKCKAFGGDDWMAYYDNEVRIYENPPSDTTFYWICLKEPLEEGATWQVSPTTTEQFEIKRIDVTVSVPAGIFEECIKVGGLGVDENQYYNIFAPTVGLVKYKEVEYGELIRYELQ